MCQDLVQQLQAITVLVRKLRREDLTPADISLLRELLNSLRALEQEHD